MYAITAQQMRELEERCNRWGLDYRTLMENAGTAAAYQIDSTIPVDGKNCMVFVGKGSNGGDGSVAARVLHGLGAQVQLVLAEGEPSNRLCREMLDRVDAMGMEILDFTLDRPRVEALLDEVDIVVDAVYGTGFHGSLSDEAAAACAAVNNAIAAVFAIDLPSGVEADRAGGDTSCVCADFTLALHSLKPAHLLPLTAKQCGQILLVDIGIPEELQAEVEYRYALVDDEMVFDLLPQRVPDSHKGDYGKVLCIVGSAAYPGAAVLATLGALRCGVGYAKLATVPSVSQTAALHFAEPVHLPLPQNGAGRISAQALPLLEAHIRSASAIVIGCGLGVDEDTTALLTQVLRQAACPVVVDGDGINILAENIHVLDETSAQVVLTPHLGELSRLMGLPKEELLPAPQEAVERFAQQHRVTVVCKGHRSVVCPPQGGWYLNTTGNAGLAKAGSGDLLAGMIGALAAQGVEPHLAAACGVYLHGLAADSCAQRLSQTYMQPTDVAQSLAGVFLAHGR